MHIYWYGKVFTTLLTENFYDIKQYVQYKLIKLVYTHIYYT